MRAHMDTVGMLTSRERVQRMFERREQDRVPRHDTYWRETIERWQREGLEGDAYAALEELGTDFCGLGGSWPAPFPGQNQTLAEDELTKTYVDTWGATVRYWKNRSGTPEHIAFGCDCREAWEKTYKPAYQKLRLNVDSQLLLERYRDGRAKDRWCFLTGLESIEATRRLLGDEITLIAMAEDPDWIMEVSRDYTDAVIRGLDDHMATGIESDGLWIYGDMAFNHSTMCSPAMYREIIWPDHKRLADWAHAHGMKFIYHTDGNVNGVLDLYLEAGFDCLQPLEAKAGMDVRKLAPNLGDRMALFGNINVMVMATEDRDAIEHEIRTKLDAGKAARCYAYHSDHSVPPTVSWDTYRFIIKLLDRYGQYA